MDNYCTGHQKPVKHLLRLLLLLLLLLLLVPQVPAILSSHATLNLFSTRTRFHIHSIYRFYAASETYMVD
ncbi:hypothetical protein E2C01_051586 [Portunus trituberculatus]|uniref:Uncharacterized protein n=1 Tax=Portunus trituberculatus TaxID=210409 RepID=A0A5B7GF75_PORTR|nr:hypothetical protein [Portunus trituberculatus]